MSNSKPKKETPKKPTIRKTKQRRINLTVDAELEGLLHRFAAAQDQSVSGSIVAFLRDISPQILGITEALEHAKRQPYMAKEKLLDMLLEAQQTANQGQLEISGMVSDLRAKKAPTKPEKPDSD